MDTSVHEKDRTSFILFHVSIDFGVPFRPAMYTSERLYRAFAQTEFYRISAANDAAAAAGSAASTMERATMTKSAPASMAARALPP
jgi:hypothetical protein